MVLIDTYVALWSLMELSTVIVPELKTWHAARTMIGSIKVLELTEILVGSLITFERLNIAKQSRIQLFVKLIKSTLMSPNKITLGV